jgi:hypothetical protein
MSLRANTQSTSTREYVEYNMESRSEEAGILINPTAPRCHIQEAGTKGYQGDQGIRNKVHGTNTLTYRDREGEEGIRPQNEANIWN